jgi:hypothetical protein
MNTYPDISGQKRGTSSWMRRALQEKERPRRLSGLDTATNGIDGAAIRTGNF